MAKKETLKLPPPVSEVEKFRIVEKWGGTMILLPLNGGDRKYDKVTAKAIMDVIVANEKIVQKVIYGRDGLEGEDKGTMQVVNKSLFLDEIWEDVLSVYGYKVEFIKKRVRGSGIFLRLKNED